LQAFVVSIRTVWGNRLIPRLNAPPIKEQDILESVLLSRFIPLFTIYPFSGSFITLPGMLNNTSYSSLKRYRQFATIYFKTPIIGGKQ